jgi:hypothetical protein
VHKSSNDRKDGLDRKDAYCFEHPLSSEIWLEGDSFVKELLVSCVASTLC